MKDRMEKLYPSLVPLDEKSGICGEELRSRVNGEDWLLAYSLDPHDDVSRWNFEAMYSALSQADPQNVARGYHQDAWYGWTEQLAVRQSTRAERIAVRLLQRMRRCCVLDFRRWHSQLAAGPQDPFSRPRSHRRHADGAPMDAVAA